MNWEIRRIPLMPLVKISFIVYLLLSLVVMLLYGLFLGSMAGMISGLLEEDFGAALPLTGGALLFGGLIVSVIASVIYTFITFIGGVVYNAVAGMVGGLEVELEPANGPSELANYVHPHLPQPPVAQQPVVVQQPVAAPLVEPAPQAPPQPQSPPPAQEPQPSSSGDKDHERYMPPGSQESGEAGWGWGGEEQEKKD
ncbi:DUF3566 domain-containing protein [bacterium]|nr:DUF3566 domain-containing protein [bacterium]